MTQVAMVIQELSIGKIYPILIKILLKFKIKKASSEKSRVCMMLWSVRMTLKPSKKQKRREFKK